ncbi:unnamed protein product [Calicophoron daubneyi]|uniref:GOLD domain-containing protein n=1 Tax=Calicophoron daubneyi TaxID=300641 RepID=A0AAV2SYZ7_CALDB
MLLVLDVFLLLLACCQASVYMFELEDRSSQCYYNTLRKGDEYELDFQVISGGNYDVDFTLSDPTGKILVKKERSSYYSMMLNDTMDGDYKVCFSNAFSSFTHKTVYLGWYNSTELTYFPASERLQDHEIRESLKMIARHLEETEKIQIGERMMGALSYSFASQLNSRVMLWSIILSVMVIIVSVGQVYLLRSFFNIPTARHATFGSVGTSATHPKYGY